MKSEVFERVYVDVKAAFNATGNLMPLEIKWVDGEIFEIDKVSPRSSARSPAPAWRRTPRPAAWLAGISRENP